MRHLYFLVLAAMLMIQSCSSDDVISESNAKGFQEKEIELVKIDGQKIVRADSKADTRSDNGTYALSFSSQSAYDNIMKELASMSHRERISFIESEGLTSLQEIAIQADEELEQIGENAQSEEEFREAYNSFVQKYKGVLITNPYDTDDLSLYVPDGDNLMSYLVNSSRLLVVNGVIESADLSTEMSESDLKAFSPEYSSTRATTWYQNSYNSKYYDGKKKLTIQLSIEDPAEGTMNVHMGAQKKMWYGWKRDDNREFYFQPNLSNFTYLVYVNSHLVSAPQAERYCYKDCDGKLDLILGKRGSLTNEIISGKMLFWTDLIAESDANGNPLTENKKVLVGTTLQTASVRKCLESKAIHINVAL